MKRILFLLIVLLTTGMVSAQQREGSITVVGDAVHDFGDIKESDGPVSHSFTMLNNGEMPIKLSRVVASCSCTTTFYTQEPIAPGKTGEIKASFNPSGYRGEVIRTITVYMEGKSGSYTLTFKCNVIP